MEQSFNCLDILALQLFLGSIIYIIGSIILIILLNRYYKIKFSNKLVLISVQLGLTYIFSIIIWCYISQDCDIMFLEFINIPALIAECLSIPFFLIIIKRIYDTK